MRAEAAGAGFYDSPWGTKHPRLQVLTIAELLAGKGIDMPPSRDVRTFKKAQRRRRLGERLVTKDELLAGRAAEMPPKAKGKTQGTQGKLIEE